ncbi:response regulator transcription factor [Microbacterium sp. B24]|uniref:response regulator transcription factor n=1 Tax=Microbacterium sp. B24 TaxID=95616 RepID=UPI0035B56E79
MKTAVIIEDDPDIRHLIVEVLEAAGFSTVSVGNGIDGVRAVLSYQPLVTTLDVNMPGIDGFEAARRIRAQSDTFIIMITGLEEEADVVVGLGSGADDYIVKPFRPRELRARIDSLLRRPRATAGGAPRLAAPRQEVGGPSFPGARPGAPRVPDYGMPQAPAAGTGIRRRPPAGRHRSRPSPPAGLPPRRPTRPTASTARSPPQRLRSRRSRRPRHPPHPFRPRRHPPHRRRRRSRSSCPRASGPSRPAAPSPRRGPPVRWSPTPGPAGSRTAISP